MEHWKESSSLWRPNNVLDHYLRQYVGDTFNDFQVKEGETPFAGKEEVIGITILYLLTLYMGQKFMKHNAVIKATLLFRLHNIFLSAISFILLVLILDEVIPGLYNHGWYHSVCSGEMYTPRLELLLYLNHLCKVYELLDTVFLVLRKKNLEFLHVYHHCKDGFKNDCNYFFNFSDILALTMILTYTQLVGRTTLAWLVVSINLLVHVIMYYYYFRAAGGARIWWKRYLTTLQISQFVVDLVIMYFCGFQYFAFTYTTWPSYGHCHSTEFAAIFGCVLITSYLVLFVDFFRKTYHQRKASAIDKKTN